LNGRSVVRFFKEPIAVSAGVSGPVDVASHDSSLSGINFPM
jgi:hypothetical protein